MQPTTKPLDRIFLNASKSSTFFSQDPQHSNLHRPRCGVSKKPCESLGFCVPGLPGKLHFADFPSILRVSSMNLPFHAFNPFYPIGPYLTPPHVDGMGSQCGGFLQRARLQEWATSRAEEAGKGLDHSANHAGVRVNSLVYHWYAPITGIN